MMNPIKEREQYEDAWGEGGQPVQPNEADRMRAAEQSEFAEGYNEGEAEPQPVSQGNVDFKPLPPADEEAAPAAAPAEMSFADALAAAKAEGKSEFEWNGKRYGTSLRNDRQPAAAPKAKAALLIPVPKDAVDTAKAAVRMEITKAKHDPESKTQAELRATGADIPRPATVEAAKEQAKPKSGFYGEANRSLWEKLKSFISFKGNAVPNPGPGAATLRANERVKQNQNAKGY